VRRGLLTLLNNEHLDEIDYFMHGNVTFEKFSRIIIKSQLKTHGLRNASHSDILIHPFSAGRMGSLASQRSLAPGN
jgi:hypothetical protein